MSDLPIEFRRAAEVFGDAVAIKANEWECLCPAHDDHKRSLWIKRGERGLVLACRAGCKSEEIIAAAGLKMADLFPERTMNERPQVVATYCYTDAKGKLLFQVQRTNPKGFRQRRKPTPHDSADKIKGGWVWSVEGVDRVLYRLPDVLRSKCVIVVEGEKDADRIASLKLAGVAATTCAMGAGKWQPQYTEALRGRRVVILPDNDDPGRKHAAEVAEAVRSVAEDVRVVELPDLPPKGDVSDWLDAGHSAAELVEQLKGTAPRLPTVGSQTDLTPDDVTVLAALLVSPEYGKAAADRLAAHLRSKGVLA